MAWHHAAVTGEVPDFRSRCDGVYSRPLPPLQAKHYLIDLAYTRAQAILGYGLLWDMGLFWDVGYLGTWGYFRFSLLLYTNT